jgi:hypothetical protein
MRKTTTSFSGKETSRDEDSDALRTKELFHSTTVAPEADVSTADVRFAATVLPTRSII